MRRLARESQGEWEDKLRMISRCGSERLTASMKSQAGRENRFQSGRERHGTLPFARTPSTVRSKIQKFHHPICLVYQYDIES